MWLHHYNAYIFLWQLLHDFCCCTHNKFIQQNFQVNSFNSVLNIRIPNVLCNYQMNMFEHCSVPSNLVKI